MRRQIVLVVGALVLTVGAGLTVAAGDKTPEQVGEQVAIEGTFVRVAANDEGWVVVGYRIANESVGEEWMLLDVGISLTDPDATHTLTRDDIKLVTPDNKVLSLPSQEDYEKVHGSLIPLVKRAAMVGDSINYFPREADRRCSMDLFAEPGAPRPQFAEDKVELSGRLACLGRVFFELPGGIEIGNYNLDVKFDSSIVKVPMEIMNREREKEFTKQWKEAQKEARHKK